LKEILEERSMTQKQLADKTGLRQNTISDMAKDLRDSVNKKHIALIADALEISDLNELMYIEK
jgi:putative transcriptional regulator